VTDLPLPCHRKEEFRFQYRKPGPSGDGQGADGAIKTQQAIEAIYNHIDREGMHEEVHMSVWASPSPIPDTIRSPLPVPVRTPAWVAVGGHPGA
jgi:hypothetical protein